MTDKPPLSPHLQVYRLPATAVASICHRVSGVALALLLMVAVPVGLMILAWAPKLFDAFVSVAQSIWFTPVQLLIVLTLVYHVLSGVRHLAMDCGLWLGKTNSLVSAWVLFSASVLISLTVVFL
ncbi:MAG: succinate dehydrogenase, cytochrome b556 subunit [Gammaproteobacteria bacterium]|nr:succinate dehydrogenase, cytochrome b556 subunit [Gammaproteobacteria bacterium]